MPITLTKDPLRHLTLTYDEVVTLLDGFVAQVGEDFVYPGAGSNCVYFEDNNAAEKMNMRGHEAAAFDLCDPSCIVGHVFHAKGVSARWLWEYGVDGHNFGGVVEVILIHGSIDLDTANLLAWVQDYQDGGAPWANSVKIAKHKVSDNQVHPSLDISRFTS